MMWQSFDDREEILREKKKKNRIEILGIAMLVLLISGVCMIPCFKTGLPYGDDQQVHMLRVESILKALKSGQGYPVYIYQTMLEGYGYGMGIFYPDLFLLASRSLQTSGGHHRRLQ